MTTHLGIIGLSADKSAWATAAHVGPLRASPLSEKYTITALATSSPESAQKAAEAHGVPKDKAYSSAEDIANDPDVDMVVVSVRVDLHKQLTVPALHAKKDVFVEWPLGNNLQEAQELAALAQKQGVKTAVALQARLLPSVRKAKEIIDSGALGRVLNTTIVSSTSIWEYPSIKYAYLNDPTVGASMISIPVPHALDPLCFLLGEFKSLSATTTIALPTVQYAREDGSKTEPVERKFADSIGVQGVLESGALVSFTLASTTAATPGYLQWVITGEKGSLKFEASGPFLVMTPPTLYQHTHGEGKEWEIVDFASTSFGGIGGVYAAFADGEKSYVDFDEAVKRHRMVEAVERSATRGTRESY